MSNTREFKSAFIRKIISPSMRYELREVAAWFREQVNRACLWRWEIARLRLRNNSAYDILYAGRKIHRVELAAILPGIEDGIDTGPARVSRSGQTVFVSEMPFPDSICVPQFLSPIVPLKRPIEEIIATYDENWRRSLRNRRAYYRVQHVLSEADIERAHQEMLYPFASARHGSSAVQRSSEYVQKSALGYGRLDFVLTGNEVVGCMLGNESIRAGKRYWVLDRCGYPETVYSDPKRLGEINSITFHLALEWAVENEFDYYDLGRCFANPDDGLLQFKRRRGAELNTIGLRGHGHFYIRLPKIGAAQFLWNNPLFAVEGQKLTLHLGLPDGSSDDKFATRYRQMGYSGISKIYLHCATPPGRDLLAMLGSIYKHQKSTPSVQIITST